MALELIALLRGVGGWLADGFEVWEAREMAVKGTKIQEYQAEVRLAAQRRRPTFGSAQRPERQQAQRSLRTSTLSAPLCVHAVFYWGDNMDTNCGRAGRFAFTFATTRLRHKSCSLHWSVLHCALTCKRI